MQTSDFLDKVALSREATAVFEQSTSPNPEEIENLRVFMEEFLWEHTIVFQQRDFLGYYQCDRESRMIRGMWPVSVLEACFFLLYASTAVFDTVSVERSFRWIRDLTLYDRHIKQDQWRDACDRLKKLFQKKMVG